MPNTEKKEVKIAETESRFETDAPETRAQAEELLKNYYKNNRADLPPNAKRGNLESWKLNEDGTLVVVDGTSGRKITFVVNEEAQAEVQTIVRAEDAETAALDAEVLVENARATLIQLEAELKAKQKAAKEAEAEAKTQERTAAKAEAKNKPKGKSE